MYSADEIILQLNLKPLPKEGGYFCETYRGNLKIPAGLPGNIHTQEKSISTAIYYLLTPDTFSALHRLPTDEIYHFYLGDPVEMLLLHPHGKSEVAYLGGEIEKGQEVQKVVPAGVWQGSRLAPGGRWALMGTTMAPGFDYTDYEGAHGDQLIGEYPDKTRLIKILTGQE